METLARAVLKTPIEIQVGGRSVVNSDISQSVEIRPAEDRFLRLLEILGEWYEKGKVLVFVSSQEDCDNLFRDLLKVSPSPDDIPAVYTPTVSQGIICQVLRRPRQVGCKCITGSSHLVSSGVMRGAICMIAVWLKAGTQACTDWANQGLCCVAGGLPLPVAAWRQGPERQRVHHQ